MIHTAEWDTIDLERTGNEEYALIEVVQEDNSFATETASEQNKDSTRFQGFPKLGWADRFTDLRLRKALVLTCKILE